MWRFALERRGLKVSRIKIQHLCLTKVIKWEGEVTEIRDEEGGGLKH